MKRIWILTVVVGVILAALAVPAIAKKPDKPGPPPDDEPLAGYTCEELGDWTGAPVADDFDIALDFRGNACIDVLSAEGPWQFTIEYEEGTLRELLVIPRDSVAPGDSCGGIRYRKEIPSEFTLPPDGYGEPTIPAAYVNACGTEFAEWVDGVYYSEAVADIESPLVLQVFWRGSSDLDATLHVDLP